MYELQAKLVHDNGNEEIVTNRFLYEYELEESWNRLVAIHCSTADRELQHHRLVVFGDVYVWDGESAYVNENDSDDVYRF